jgi:hypothetical protein
VTTTSCGQPPRPRSSSPPQVRGVCPPRDALPRSLLRMA